MNNSDCIRCGSVMTGTNTVAAHPVSSGTVFSKVEDYHCDACNVHTTITTTTHVPGTKENT